MSESVESISKENTNNGSISRENIEDIIYDLLDYIGEDPQRDNLKETWKRRAPDTWKTISEGYREKEKPDMKTFPVQNDGLIFKKDIPFQSMCEHHLLPFIGEVNIGYIPDGKIVGISKLIRYTKWKSRKLHTQEKLTTEIVNGLMKELDPKGVIVLIKAEHMCESMRGVETPNTKTITQASKGVFKNSSTRQDLRKEFMNKIN